ncbi:hypothetical protein [Streptomyces sp. NPDC127033]|uniref:hypothetical protein n=1 Tax=Streptomyces sp. NPDC127033 TaxID=3347110 RepID=UPI00365DACC7
MTETHSTTAEQWSDRLEYRLAGQPGMDRATITEILDEVTAHCAETGLHPEEAFGPPDEFAVQAAGDRVPVEERARRDWAFRSPSSYWSTGLIAVTGMLALFAVFTLVETGLWFDVTVSGLSGIALIVGASQLCWLALGRHADGRLRSAAVAGGGAAVLVVGAALAFLSLPDDRLTRFPTLALLPVCVALHALTVRLRPEDDGSAAASPEPADPTDPEQWLRRLEALLRGRHKLPRRRAAELVAEARDHLAVSGSSPAEEFGSVAVYALRLAEHAGPRAWWSRSAWVESALTAVVLTVWAVRLYQGDTGWVFWVVTALLAVAGLIRAVAALTDRPSNQPSGKSERSGT